MSPQKKQARLLDLDGQECAVVGIEPADGFNLWPDALQYRGRLFVFSFAGQYREIVAYKIQDKEAAP